MQRRFILVFCLALVVPALCRPSALTAGKPAPPPPPPPPSGDPTLIYEYRPELGGWLDTTRNLLWGTYASTSFGGGISYDSALIMAADYAAILAEASLYWDERSSYWQAEGDLYAVSDPDRAARHYQTAQDCADAADELFAQSLAASVVEGNNTWRLPSKAEFEDAYSKGMFTYGEGGLNGFDRSAVPGIQPVGAGRRYWTATAHKNRYQWSFDPVAGISYSSYMIGARLDTVVVRDYTPPPAP